MTEPSEREQFAQIYSELSDEAKELITAVLRLEQEHLHIGEPRGIPDQIVRKVEGIVK